MVGRTLGPSDSQKALDDESEGERQFAATAATSIFDTKVDDLMPSVRAKNVLASANVLYLGDLVQFDESQLLSLQNCGRKTVAELRERLEQRGLSFGMGLDSWRRPEPSIDVPSHVEAAKALSDFDEAMRTKFYLRISELGLSPRAQHVLAEANVKYVGDLLAMTESALIELSSCGRTTIAEIKDRLQTLGLRLGMSISDWSSDAAALVRKQQDRQKESPIVLLRRSLTPLPVASSLENELGNVLRAVASDRDVEIAIKQLGWSGKGQRTLESVGQEYNVTRERIRQIVARTTDRISDREFATPWLEKSLATVRKTCPATAHDISAALRADGITKSEFDPSGIESACDVFGMDFGFVRISIGGVDVYAKSSRYRNVRKFYHLCRKWTSAQGCANFDVLCDELKVPEAERRNYRRVAEIGGICEWLDDDKRWLITTSVPRNRLSNIVAKVLSVAPRVHLQELRRAIARSRRLAVVPPVSVLARFVEYQRLGTVSGNRVVANPNIPGPIEPGTTEHTLIATLRAYGPILAWDRFEELCMAAGMNPITFSIYLSGSPVISRVARGIYALVGADVPPGVVEDLMKELSAARKPAEWGWSERGTLWYALRITGTVLASGSVPIPSFVSEIADGEWQPLVGGRNIDGPIKCNGRFIWGLRRPLINSGAEPEDVCILEFDLTKRTVNLTVGGEELVDIWESGDIELPAPGAPDVEDVD